MGLIGPAPRATRAEIVISEKKQAEVIAELSLNGETSLFERTVRCQSARLLRGERYSCRLSCCSACQRLALRAWWRGVLNWISPDASLIVIPLEHRPGEILEAGRKLRRAIRDVRDRRGRTADAWRAVEVVGLITGDKAWLFVDGMSAERTLEVFQRRWPKTSLVKSWEFPRCSFCMEDTLSLALKRRGIEPLRVVVPSQQRPDVAHVPEVVPLPVIVSRNSCKSILEGCRSYL